MKKKTLQKWSTMILMMALLATALAGCSKKEENKDSNDISPTQSVQGNSSDSSDNNDSEENKEDGVWEGEITKIIVTFATAGVEPVDLPLVQDAINEISKKEAGVEIQFKPVSIFEIGSTCPMWIAGGEVIDLMVIAFTSLEPYITQNMIQPIEQWKDLAPEIWKLSENYPIFDINHTGHKYGLAPVSSGAGQAGGYLIAVEDLEAAGLSYEDGQLITLDELDHIFTAINEAKPDVKPCGVVGTMDRASHTFIYDPLGSSANTGVLIGLDSTKVVNMYTTTEYKNYLEHVRSWYEKGYILKDAATSDISLIDMTASGALSGYFSEGNAGLRNQLELKTGREYIHLMFNEPYRTADAGNMGSYYTIPVTAKEPEAAMRFMNLMYKDSRITNLLIWGIEGTHYVVTDEEENTITYPEGINASNNPYAYGLGLYGNQLELYTMGISTKTEDEAWAETANSRKTKGYGFCYDTSSMTNQIIAVQAVITEYIPALTTGSVDLESTYKEFIKKLEDNGINDIIADKQAQFDAWLAQQ